LADRPKADGQASGEKGANDPTSQNGISESSDQCSCSARTGLQPSYWSSGRGTTVCPTGLLMGLTDRRTGGPMGRWADGG
ncbi:unnamed protein product, partial [Protopolystoma xenopodis]